VGQQQQQQVGAQAGDSTEAPLAVAVLLAMNDEGFAKWCDEAPIAHLPMIQQVRELRATLATSAQRIVVDPSLLQLPEGQQATTQQPTTQQPTTQQPTTQQATTQQATTQQAASHTARAAAAAPQVQIDETQMLRLENAALRREIAQHESKDDGIDDDDPLAPVLRQQQQQQQAAANARSKARPNTMCPLPYKYFQPSTWPNKEGFTTMVEILEPSLREFIKFEKEAAPWVQHGARMMRHWARAVDEGAAGTAVLAMPDKKDEKAPVTGLGRLGDEMWTKLRLDCSPAGAVRDKKVLELVLTDQHGDDELGARLAMAALSQRTRPDGRSRSGERRQRDPAGVTCYACEVKGHVWQDCPDATKKMAWLTAQEMKKNQRPRSRSATRRF
jgi:hypothetical protein